MSLTCVTTAGADSLLQRTSTSDEPSPPRRQAHRKGCGFRAERQYGQNNLKQAERKSPRRTERGLFQVPRMQSQLTCAQAARDWASACSSTPTMQRNWPLRSALNRHRLLVTALAAPLPVRRIVRSEVCGAVPIMSHVPSGAEQAGAKETEVSRHPSGILTETSCRGPTGAASRFLSRQAFTRPGDLRNIQLRFSFPPDHGNHMDPGSLRLVLAPLSIHSSPCDVQMRSSTQYNLRGICILLRVPPNRLPYRHMSSPVPSYCVHCGSWLISCGFLAVAVLRPTPTTNCSAQPVISLR